MNSSKFFLFYFLFSSWSAQAMFEKDLSMLQESEIIRFTVLHDPFYTEFTTYFEHDPFYVAQLLDPNDAQIKQIIQDSNCILDVIRSINFQKLSSFDMDFAVQELKKKFGEQLNSRVMNSWTPLHFAASWGYAPSVRLLLAAGANLIQQTSYRQTPLYLAQYNKHAEVTQVLQQALDKMRKASDWRRLDLDTK